MGEKNTILQHYFIDNWGIKKIAREMEVARNTVRSYVNEFSSQKAEIIAGGDKYSIIEEMKDPPKYDTSSRKRTVVTDDIIDFVKKCLEENERKKLTGKRKLCQNCTDIHRELTRAGFTVSYPTVTILVRQLSDMRKEAFIKQDYRPGEVCEFDWGYFKLTVGGKEIEYNMAVFTLAARNIRYAYLYHKEDKQSFVDSHIKAFSFFDAVPHLMVYDNMRVAISKFVGKFEKHPTVALVQTSTYYGFSFRFCNIRKANEKGHVERSVDYVRRVAFSGKDIFDSEEEAKERLLQTLTYLNSKNGGMEEEKNGMLPKVPDYSSVSRVTGLVDKWSSIVTGTNHYSVPDFLVGKEVEIYIYIDMIIAKYEGKEVARHERSYERKEFFLNILHYRETLRRKPGALSNSLCLKQSPKILQETFDRFFKENPKEFIASIEMLGEYSIFQIKKACETLSENHVQVSCEAIRMMLTNKPDLTLLEGNEPDEIELACLQELRQFALRGHAV